MKISVVRGAFLNPFELQNYYPLVSKHDIQAISSKYPINTDIKIPLVRLYSPTDLPNFPYKYPVLNRLFGDAHYLWGLNNAIEGSDIVHVAETYYHYTKQAIEAKQKGLVDKVVSTVWEIIPHNNETLAGRRKIKKLAYQYIDHFLAVTQKAKEALIKEGVERGRITVIPTGVDLHKFSPVHKKGSKKTTQILYVGRLVPEKGIDQLLQIFHKLRQEGEKIELTVVGNGPLKKAVKESAAQLKSVPYAQIQKEYQKADIFCLLSKPTSTWQEQYGMVLVEAMATGLPILTTSSGAIPEVCSSAAILVEPGNTQQTYQSLRQLIKDNKLREKLGREARQRAEKRFDYQKIAQQINHLYHKVKS